MAKARIALERPWKWKQVAYVCAREVGTSRGKVWWESVTGEDKSPCMYWTRKRMSPMDSWILNETLVEDFDYVVLPADIFEMLHRKNLQCLDLVRVQRWKGMFNFFCKFLIRVLPLKPLYIASHRVGMVWLLLKGKLPSSAAMASSFDPAAGCYVVSP